MITSVLTHADAVRSLGPQLYTTLPQAGLASYDRKAALYDAIVGREAYNRLVWGCSTQAYRRFAREALDAAGDGCFLEGGCGSLLFSSQLYGNARCEMAILADVSLQMLERGAQRLRGQHRKLPERVVLLHSDITALPIRAGAVSSILSLGVLHLPVDVDAIISELSRILDPNRGRLFATALVRSGRWSDRYLAALHRAGEVGPPTTVDELQRRVARHATIESFSVQGNMCFLVSRPR